MKLIEALKLARNVSEDAPTVHIISSMETNLFETYFKAVSVDQSSPRQTTSSEFGELSLSLLNFFESAKEIPSLLVILDWEDLIPGSSFRSSSPLQNQTSASLEKTEQIIDIMTRGASSGLIGKITIVLPAMACAPLGPEPRQEINKQQHHQQSICTKLAELALNHPKISVLNPEEILCSTPKSSWTTLSGLFQSGWPYTPEATWELAQITFDHLHPKHQRKKILITDLDGVLWKGIIGEDGPENVSFAADADGYKHLFYQKFLNRLMSEGVLVAICSKNESAVAQKGLKRDDLVLKANRLVGVRASWDPKSTMIEDLLQKVNLLPESAVFIDDSSFELEELKSKFPEITTVQFPRDNSDFQNFVEKVQTLFTTPHLTEEDKNRTQSYLARKTFEKQRQTSHNIEDYLRSLEMKSTIDEVTSPTEERPLQLINKTNQFNLNGLRETSESWQGYFNSHSHVLKVRLKDRLADHGIVSVLVVKEERSALDIYHFVLSCRVFSRQLEFGIMDELQKIASQKGLSQIRVRYAPTQKNKPLQDFLKYNGIDPLPSSQKEPQFIPIIPQQTNTFSGKLESSLAIER